MKLQRFIVLPESELESVGYNFEKFQFLDKLLCEMELFYTFKNLKKKLTFAVIILLKLIFMKIIYDLRTIHIHTKCTFQ